MSGETRLEPSSQTLALDRIDSAPFQIRQSIDEDRLRELATSMKQCGLLQPIVVRPKGDRFEVVAGERRFRAAKMLQWSAIPCRVAELSDLDAEVAKLVENEQRVDAKPLERARAFAHLRDAFNLEQEEIARLVRVDKSVVSRTLALLQQPAEIQKLVADESISPAHLRSLKAVADESKRVELAAQAARERLTAKETRRRAREAVKSAGAKPSEAAIASTPAETEKRGAEERSSSTSFRAADEIATPPAESRSSTAIQSPDATPAQPKSVDAAVPAARNEAPLTQTERGATDLATVQAQAIEQRIANWCIAIGSALRGPWRSAVWDFYERMTDLAYLWRLVKPVLKFLARFIPGREREPSRMRQLINFRNLNEPTNSEGKKPDANPT